MHWNNWRTADNCVVRHRFLTRTLTNNEIKIPYGYNIDFSWVLHTRNRRFVHKRPGNFYGQQGNALLITNHAPDAAMLFSSLWCYFRLSYDLR